MTLKIWLMGEGFKLWWLQSRYLWPCQIITTPHLNIISLLFFDYKTTIVYTFHESIAIVACTKSCSDQIIRICMTAKWGPPWWRHQIETFSALLVFCAGNSTVTGEFPTHKGQWRGALMFSLIFAWANGWTNHRDAGDLRRQWRHYNASEFELRWEYHSWNETTTELVPLDISGSPIEFQWGSRKYMG